MDNKIQTSNESGGEQEILPKQFTGSGPIDRLGLKPTHMLAITIAGIFLAEVIAMMNHFLPGNN
jgi:hypothetical protein